MRIIIPIRGPELEFLDDEYKKILDDVNAFGENEKLVNLIDNDVEHRNISSIKFTVLLKSKFSKLDKEEIQKLTNKYPGFRTKYIQEFVDIELNLKRTYAEPAMNPIIVDLIIQKIALLVSLSYSTKIDFLEGLILGENEIYLGKTSTLINNIDFSYEHAMKIMWPNIKSLSINQTVDWFILNKLHTDGSSKNKLQRAINAFSYLFSNIHEKDSSNLFWIMLGIEALLAEGSHNIINQIKAKTALILGEPTEYKKKLDKLYNYRSRLVHGDYDFPAKFSSDFDIFEDEYWDYLSFATSILLALIRNLIDEGKSEYTFEYKLV